MSRPQRRSLARSNRRRCAFLKRRRISRWSIFSWSSWCSRGCTTRWLSRPVRRTKRKVRIHIDFDVSRSSGSISFSRPIRQLVPQRTAEYCDQFVQISTFLWSVPNVILRKCQTCLRYTRTSYVYKICSEYVYE